MERKWRGGCPLGRGHGRRLGQNGCRADELEEGSLWRSSESKRVEGRSPKGETPGGITDLAG